MHCGGWVGRKRRAPRREEIFSEYLENEEACLRSERWKFVFSSGRRQRGDGYETDNPTPGRWVRLFDLKADPGEFTDQSRRRPELVARFERILLDRFRRTHPEAPQQPQRLSVEEAIEWYLRPRDRGPG